MWNWPALLLAPLLALTNQSITYALVTPSCAKQNMLAPHAVAAVSLILCILFTLSAWKNYRRWRPGKTETGDAASARESFLAMVATMVGALSSVVIVAMWLPLFILSPCAS
jgi:hypothetical protein